MVHSSLQILSKSLRFLGCLLETRSFSSLHRFSMGLRSGDWLGHSMTLMCFFLSHSFVALAVCLGHCHAGRPIHDPYSVFWLRKGSSHLLRVCVHGVCVFTAVCVHFGWVNADHKFREWVTILGHMSRHSLTFTHLIFYSTWPRPLAPQCGEVVLYP